MFATELEMSLKFEEFLFRNVKKRKKEIDYIFEVNGIVGIPDCILIEKTEKNLKTIITFELKLKAWKRALYQAMKFKLYSNISFVVMSEQGITAAKKNLEIFKKNEIGLIEFTIKNNLKIHYMPDYNLPISELYVHLLYEQLIKQNKLEKSKRVLKLYLEKNILERILMRELLKYKIEE